MQELNETVSCIWCARPTHMIATRQCDRCNELAKRIGCDIELTRRILRVNHDFETVKVKT